VSNGKTEAMVRVGKQRPYIGEGEFNKAFADAKAAGKKTFTWDGRLYKTEEGVVGKQRSYIGEGEFNKALADAKAAGKKTFTWDGRLYKTETAEKPEKKKLYKKILKKKAPKAKESNIMSNGKDKKKSNSPGMYKEWISEEGGEEDIFAKRDKYRKSFWKTSPNVKVRNKGLAGAEVTKKGGAYAFYRKKSKAAQLFRKAFADAKAAGKKTFTWDGRLYTTETAEKPEKKKPRS